MFYAERKKLFLKIACRWVWLQFSFDKQHSTFHPWVEYNHRSRQSQTLCVQPGGRLFLVCVLCLVTLDLFDLHLSTTGLHQRGSGGTLLCNNQRCDAAAVTLYLQERAPACLCVSCNVLICVFVPACLMPHLGDTERRFCHTQFRH